MILGSTGRNFAAGMSGGRAFVLDLNPYLVNKEMVDVLAVPNDQRESLHSIINSFFNETESQMAGNLLLDWENSLSRFSLVMPRDYARVIAAMEKATREGLPVDQYVMEVVANG